MNRTPATPLFLQALGLVAATLAAVFVAAGALFTWRRLEIEALTEWNPWFSMERGNTAAGSLNIYGVAGVRWQVRGVRVLLGLVFPFGLMAEGVRRIRRAAAGLDVLGPAVEPPPPAKVIER